VAVEGSVFASASRPSRSRRRAASARSQRILVTDWPADRLGRVR